MSNDDSSPTEIEVRGIFEPGNQKNGSLLQDKYRGKSRPSDPFVPRELIRRFKLKRGSLVTGKAQSDSRFPNPKLRFIETIDGLSVEDRRQALAFEQLTTITPDSWLRLEREGEASMTTRVIDIFCPIGKGQRGLIVAPPRTGKTTLLRDIALGVDANHPECEIIMLLVDERPEEVTDLARTIPGRLFASSNDENAKSHLYTAELAIDHAKRLLEGGRDVVLLMDSITRLARAYNSAKSGSGRTMSGGLDIRALEKPRQLFSAARNTEEAGSLTIIASALIETGSRMDDLIFQEFKGTGNMEIYLDRHLAEKRIFPAIDMNRSGTRKEELLLDDDVLNRVWILRKVLAPMNSIDSMEFLLDKMRGTKSNQEFLDIMNK